MRDVRFEFERPIMWYKHQNYSKLSEVEYARDCFRMDRNEIYDIVRDLESEWKASNGDVDFSAFMYPMNTQLSFVHVHVYPLEIEEGGEYKEGWDAVIRGSVHVRVKGYPTEEQVWEDIQQCLDDLCGDVRVDRLDE